MSGVLYANGRVPLSLLVHLGGRHYLAPGVAAAWAYLVRLGVEKYGVTLRITPQLTTWDGWNGYRPYDAQVTYRAHLGAQAAIAGMSPHGWLYGIDVWNWRELAPGNESLAWARFVALCILAGFATLRVKGEKWHIEFTGDPWAAPAFANVTINPATTNRPEEDDMKTPYVYIFWTGANGRQQNAVHSDSGFWQEWESDDATYNSGIARGYGIESSAKVTLQHAGVIHAACIRKRTGAA